MRQIRLTNYGRGDNIIAYTFIIYTDTYIQEVYMKRKALYSVICTVLILLLAAALLVACNDGVSETYILSFRDGTEVIARVELQSGESLQASDIPEAPAHDDENFVGWFIGIKEITAGYTPERSGVVVAKYEKIIKYTATFDMGGAPGDAPADVTVVENNSIQLPSVSWVGHAFLGWKLGEEPLHLADESYVMTGDVTFVAQWQEIDYTVTFSLGGAPGEDPATQHCHYGDAIKLPDEPVWAEHTFLGWYDEAGEKKDAGDKITIQDNISFTAHWQSDHSASEFVGVWMSANNYGYVVVTAAGADAFDVKGYVVGAYEAFEAQDVAYDGALGQFVVTIYKAANQQQAENVAFSISGGKLRAAGSSITPVAFDQQTDDTLAGYYLYHDGEDEVLEVVAGGLIVTNTAKLFGATQPVFAYIAADGAGGYKLVYKQRTSPVTELSSAQFEVTADGNLHVDAADTCKLFVKGATAGESFDGPDGAKLYKYTTAEGDVYAFRADATSDIVHATIEGTVAEGEEFTITYNESSHKYCKLVDGEFIYKGSEAHEYRGALGTLVLDGFGEGTLDGKDITYSYTDDEDEIIIDGVIYTLSYDTYVADEGEVVYGGKYHKVGDASITLTHTVVNSKYVIILEGGSKAGTYERQVNSRFDTDVYKTVKTTYIVIDEDNEVRLELHVINDVLKVYCNSGESEYVGEYALDSVEEPDVYPAEWTGVWASEEDNVKIKVDIKHIYIWGPDDNDWVEAFYSGPYSSSSSKDYYISYKGNENIEIYEYSNYLVLTVSGGDPFNHVELYKSIFSQEMVGNYKTDDGDIVFITELGLRYKQGQSVGAATEIVENAENDFNFTYNGESYRIWKDGDQLKLSKADGSDVKILTVAEPDGKQAVYKSTSGSSYVEFDGYGIFVYYSGYLEYTGFYTVDEDGNYIVTGTSDSSCNGKWTVSENGNVITSEDEWYTFEKDTVVVFSATDYATYIGNGVILFFDKWSVSLATTAHPEVARTYDINVSGSSYDVVYTFVLNGINYTLSGYNGNLMLNSVALHKFGITDIFDLDDSHYYYAYHNFVYISCNDVESQTVWFEDGEFRYSVTTDEGVVYNIKKEGGDTVKYYVWYNDEWLQLSTDEEEEFEYPHGVWQLEDGDTKITISGAVGNNVAYNFAVEGGSSATTSDTWRFVSKYSTNNKQFTVTIGSVEYNVEAHGSVLIITGDGDLAGIYNKVGDVTADLFTEEWFGTWTTVDYAYTIKIINKNTIEYKGAGDAQFYEVTAKAYSSTDSTRINIIIDDGVDSGHTWIIEKNATRGMLFGKSSSTADTHLYKDIFPHDFVGSYQTEEGMYVNIYVDHVAYAANANSAWIAMSELSGSGNDFNLTFGDDVYRLYEEGGALKLSKDGSVHTLTNRVEDILAGRKYSSSSDFLSFDGLGRVVGHYLYDYDGTYYIDADGTVHVAFDVEDFKLEGVYTLSEHNHVLTKGSKSYSETPIFDGIEGIYIGEGVIIVIGKYSIIIATNEHTTSEEVFDGIDKREGEYAFNALDTSYVLTNASGSLELNEIVLIKLSGKLYANDNAYTVEFSGTTITFNKEAVEEYTVSFADGKPTISFNVSDVAYTITKDADVYKISVNGDSYDMSTIPATPATIFGTWTKDDITLTFSYDESHNTYVYLTVTGGENPGDYDITWTANSSNVTRTVTIASTSYNIEVAGGKSLNVTGDGEYAGTYTKTATTEPEIVDDEFLGVWTKEVNRVNYIIIITKQHMWLRDINNKGGDFEDFYDLVPFSTNTNSYDDVKVYWMSAGSWVNIYTSWSGGLSGASEYTACGDVTSPEEFIAWELGN